MSNLFFVMLLLIIANSFEPTGNLIH